MSMLQKNVADRFKVPFYIFWTTYESRGDCAVVFRILAAILLEISLSIVYALVIIHYYNVIGLRIF